MAQVTRITVSPETTTIEFGSTVQLTVTAYNAAGQVVTPVQNPMFTSVNPSLAAVSSSGLVTAATTTLDTLQPGGVVEIQIAAAWCDNEIPNGPTVTANAYVTVSAYGAPVSAWVPSSPRSLAVAETQTSATPNGAGWKLVPTE